MKPDIVHIGDDQHGKVYLVVLSGRIIAITCGDSNYHSFEFENDENANYYVVGDPYPRAYWKEGGEP